MKLPQEGSGEDTVEESSAREGMIVESFEIFWTINKTAIKLINLTSRQNQMEVMKCYCVLDFSEIITSTVTPLERSTMLDSSAFTSTESSNEVNNWQIGSNVESKKKLAIETDNY